MFGMFGPIAGGLVQNPDAGKPKHKGGMFGKPDWVSAIAAGLGALSAARGNRAGEIGLQMLNQRLGQKREDEQYQQRRADAFEDWKAQQSWKLQNPEPINNDTVNDWNFYKQSLSPEEFETWKQNRINPPQIMNVPGVGIVSVPRMGGQAPQAPVGKLTPIDEGGPSPLGSGHFSRPF